MLFYLELDVFAVQRRYSGMKDKSALMLKSDIPGDSSRHCQLHVGVWLVIQPSWASVLSIKWGQSLSQRIKWDNIGTALTQ